MPVLPSKDCKVTLGKRRSVSLTHISVSNPDDSTTNEHIRQLELLYIPGPFWVRQQTQIEFVYTPL
jgi:hypothetical protein